MCQYILLFISVLIVTKAIDFKLIDTLEAWNGTTESCEYDYINNRWIVFDQSNGHANQIPGTYPDYASNNFQTISSASEPGTGALGTVYAASEQAIFFADSTGSVKKYDLITNSVLTHDTISLGIPGTNGICYDSSKNLIYTTNPGVDFTTHKYNNANAGIWKIELNNNNAVTRVYNGISDTISGQANYIFHPNGCVVKDNIVYFVESRLDGTGYLGMMIIGNDVLTVDDTSLNLSGDGLTVIDNYLIMTSWGDGSVNAGSLLYKDISETNSKFAVGIQMLTSPANINIGPLNTICVPSFTTGKVYFIRFTKRQFLRKLSRTFIMENNGNPTTSASIAFDVSQRTYAYININHQDDSGKPPMEEISSDWAADESGIITDNGYIGTDYLRTSVIPSGVFAYYLAGAASADIFYGTDSWGIVFAQDFATENVINYIDLDDYITNGNNYNYILSGVCIDEINQKLYAVGSSFVCCGVNYSNIWEIDISGSAWTSTKIYSGTSIYDANHANPMVYNPTQCTAIDDTVYLVSQTDIGLGMYNVNSGSFIYDIDVLPFAASSIASVAELGVIVVTTLDYDYLNDNVLDRIGYGIYKPAEDVMVEIQFYEFVDRGGFPQQIAIDYIQGVVAVAQHIATGEGKLTFYQLDALRKVFTLNCNEDWLVGTAFAGEYRLIDFSISEKQQVTFTNCESEFDTEMELFASDGESMMDTLDSNQICSNDDCYDDDNYFCNYTKSETFTFGYLDIGSYVLKINPNRYDDGGIFKVKAICTTSAPTQVTLSPTTVYPTTSMPTTAFPTVNPTTSEPSIDATSQGIIETNEMTKTDEGKGNKESSGNTDTSLIIIWVIIALLLVLVLIWCLYKRKKAKENNDNKGGVQFSTVSKAKANPVDGDTKALITNSEAAGIAETEI